MDDIDKLIEKSKWPCGKLICVEPEYIGRFGCDGCRLNFTETRPSRYCTQCETLKAEVERLKAELKYYKDKYVPNHDNEDIDDGC